MISLSARTVGDRLEVSVGNPVDPESTPSQGDGLGLSNVSGRLDLLYRQRAKLRIDRQPDAFEVTLDLPTQIDQEPTTP